MGELSPIPDVDPDLMRAVARSVPRIDSTAPPMDQVNLVIELGALSRQIIEHNRLLMSGEPVDWAELADQLDSAARACRRHVVLDLDDAGSR